MSAETTAPQAAGKSTVFKLTPLGRRRLANFRANKRGYYSLWIFLVLYAISLCAELVANDKPLLVSYRGELLSPVFTFYPESRFGGESDAKTDYTDPVVQCLIKTGGWQKCLPPLDWNAEEVPPEEVIAEFEANPAANPASAGGGWMVWPLIKWNHESLNKEALAHPGPPSADNWFGTDTSGRDVLAVTLYGFRLSVTFGLLITLSAAVIGVAAGAAQGYFGGWVDLFFQRIVEIWASSPVLFIILIVSSVLPPNFWVLVLIMATFTWTGLVSVVRAEFLRARNFEYVRAAEALGASDAKIMFRHVLPNAMVATLTQLPFILTASIGLLATLDFLGYGLSDGYPSLGEITLQARSNLNAYWLGVTAFMTFAIMLSLLVFIFEAVRDAFDPRKTFE